MRTKHGTDCTAWYQEVADALAQLPGGPFIIVRNSRSNDEPYALPTLQGIPRSVIPPVDGS
jgi:hypothetical protein